MHPLPVGDSRRRFLGKAVTWGMGLGLAAQAQVLEGEETTVLPFENGERPLVAYPQKRALIRLTTRPPQLETPFSVFDDGTLTPNDAFFVRYHLTRAPPTMASLDPETFELTVKGAVQSPRTFSVAELKSGFENVEIVAVNQCSGNSRGFFNPRVPGGQLGHGAMGNARWRGVRLQEVLNRVGLLAGARQVLFNGLDAPLLPQTPDFIKAIDVEPAQDPDVLLAWEMNGSALPWLNGYPLRLVMPGYYGTYWVKHLHEITVVDQQFKGYWMDPAYRIPDDPCAHVAPGTVPRHTVPITRLNVRSFITKPATGDHLPSGSSFTVRGIAFDGGFGIESVLFSSDAGHTWRAATLGPDLGKYSFREWTLSIQPGGPGPLTLMARATNRLGQSQPQEPLWNPAGYMRNCVEPVRVMVT